MCKLYQPYLLPIWSTKYADNHPITVPIVSPTIFVKESARGLPPGQKTFCYL